MQTMDKQQTSYVIEPPPPYTREAVEYWEAAADVSHEDAVEVVREFRDQVLMTDLYNPGKLTVLAESLGRLMNAAYRLQDNTNRHADALAEWESREPKP